MWSFMRRLLGRWVAAFAVGFGFINDELVAETGAYWSARMNGLPPIETVLKEAQQIAEMAQTLNDACKKLHAENEELSAKAATCQHTKARVRGVSYGTMLFGMPPTPGHVTDVLMTCPDCQQQVTNRIAGKWTLDQLTHEVPAAEVVARQLEQHMRPEGTDDGKA